jgi:HK97 family phage portal protein
MVKLIREWIHRKTAPRVGQARSSNEPLDLYRSIPAPRMAELLNSYKEVVYACATTNGQAVASVPLRLYVKTGLGQAEPRCATSAITKSQAQWLRSTRISLTKDVTIEEVLEHPLLVLLNHELLEFIQLFQEIAGTAYVYKEINGLQVPEKLWLLLPQTMAIIKNENGLPIGCKSTLSTETVNYRMDDLLLFRMPNLRDPYGEGLSPARAAWESIMLLDKHVSHEAAWLDNGGMPSIIVSPKEAIGPEEAERLEYHWRQKFKRGGNGRVLVGESALDVKPLSIPPRDLEILASFGVRKEVIANAYGVPMAYLTKDTNLANLEGARQQHALLAVLPRCRRNEANLQPLCDMFDPRLFLAYDNPVPEDITRRVAMQKADAETGDTTINERRAERGLSDVSWGDKPWMPFAVSQIDTETRNAPADAPADAPIKLFNILADYQLGDISAADAVRQLTGLGKSTTILQSYKLAEPVLCCHESEGKRQRRLPSGARLSSILTSEFKQQRRDILAQLAQKIMRKATEYRVDTGGWNQRMSAAARPFIETVWSDQMRESLVRLGRSDLTEIWNVANPKVREAIAQASMSFAESTNATTTLKLDEALAQVRAALIEGILGDENTIPELTRRVGAIFDEAETYRAKQIAVTESSRAVHMAQRMSAIESGVVRGFKWLLAADACEICQDLAAKTADGISLTEVFGQNGTNPSYADIYCPPAHPNCMCSMTEILERR